MSSQGVKFNIWKKLAAQKYPEFIINILKKCAFDCNSLELLDVNSIKEIQKYIEQHPELLRKTPYEKENTENFKFKIGHKHLILGIPNFIKKISEEKKLEIESKKKTEARREVDIISEEGSEIVSLLVERIKQYNNRQNINLNISASAVKKIIKTDCGYLSKLCCTTCRKLFTCTFKKDSKNSHWKITNFTSHIRTHIPKTSTHQQVNQRLDQRTSQRTLPEIIVINSNRDDLRKIIDGKN